MEIRIIQSLDDIHFVAQESSKGLFNNISTNLDLISDSSMFPSSPSEPTDISNVILSAKNILSELLDNIKLSDKQSSFFHPSPFSLSLPRSSFSLLPSPFSFLPSSFYLLPSLSSLLLPSFSFPCSFFHVSSLPPSSPLSHSSSFPPIHSSLSFPLCPFPSSSASFPFLFPFPIPLPPPCPTS